MKLNGKTLTVRDHLFCHPKVKVICQGQALYRRHGKPHHGVSHACAV